MIPEPFKHIKLSDFLYPFSDEIIAQEPLLKRDESNLLVYKEGQIQHQLFKELPGLIPSGAQLIINNAKVIPARIFFKKSTGSQIEVFLLEPISPFKQMELALKENQTCIWACMVGHLKKWKDHEILSTPLHIDGKVITLNARLVSRENLQVELSWDHLLPLSTILEHIGNIPLPPYIKRAAIKEDSSNYQTVFAKHDGAVAAPTAGLHFTPRVITNLNQKQVDLEEVTLYVGAGTFAPVNVETMLDHNMHAEMFSVSKQCIEELNQEKLRIAVGTTSLRTLESLYWIGVKLHLQLDYPFEVEKLLPYHYSKPPLSWTDSINEVLNYLNKNSLTHLTAKTAIMIMPGYSFMSVEGLITNFHHPGTTLIMLVAAFIGDDWKLVYQSALDNQYRFLSYGDSSLLWKNLS